MFLGAVMVFRRRRRDTNGVRMERWTVHISDNTGHIAQVDVKTRDDDNIDPANPLNAALTRYQYANYLGSAVLETDENGIPLSYEEYHPYGTSAYSIPRALALNGRICSHRKSAKSLNFDRHRKELSTAFR
jgi:hypothetical protein